MKISKYQKNIRNTKVVYLHEESLPNLSMYILITVMLIYKKTCTSNSSVALPRLHVTGVDCAHELINGKSGIKGEADKVLQN